MSPTPKTKLNRLVMVDESTAKPRAKPKPYRNRWIKAKGAAAALGATTEILEGVVDDQVKKDEKPVEAWEKLETDLLHSIDHRTLNAMPPFQRIMGAGICRDKIQALRAGNTPNQIRDMIILAHERRIKAIEASRPVPVLGSGNSIITVSQQDKDNGHNTL